MLSNNKWFGEKYVLYSIFYPFNPQNSQLIIRIIVSCSPRRSKTCLLLPSCSRSLSAPAFALPLGRDPAASRGEREQAERRPGPRREVLGRRGGSTEHAKRLPGHREGAGGPRGGPVAHQAADRSSRGSEDDPNRTRLSAESHCICRSLNSSLCLPGHQGGDGRPEGGAGVRPDARG